MKKSLLFVASLIFIFYCPLDFSAVNADNHQVTSLTIKTNPHNAHITVSSNINNVSDNNVRENNEYKIVSGFTIIRASKKGYVNQTKIDFAVNKRKTIMIRLSPNTKLFGKYYRELSDERVGEIEHYIELFPNNTYYHFIPQVLVNGQNMDYICKSGWPSIREDCLESIIKGDWNCQKSIIAFQRHSKLYGRKGKKIRTVYKNNGEILVTKETELGWIREKQRSKSHDKKVQKHISKMHIVRWANRVYLLPEFKINDFIRAICLGVEPRYSKFGYFYMKTNNLHEVVEGYPTLPENYQKSLFGFLKTLYETKYITVLQLAKDENNRQLNLHKNDKRNSFRNLNYLTDRLMGFNLSKQRLIFQDNTFGYGP